MSPADGGAKLYIQGMRKVSAAVFHYLSLRTRLTQNVSLSALGLS
jgi:ornithine carbamoyltransferase